MTADYLGEFEHLVLLAILRVGEGAYGVPIREEIEERADRSVSFGAVYATLRRLHAKDLVKCESTKAEVDQGGRIRKHFSLTRRGIEAVRRSQARLARMSEGLGETIAL